jgi:hypothetical protein
MNTAKWIHHFQRNRLNRPEPDWHAPITLTPDEIARVLPSLQQFQLGDGGGPACLIAGDAERFRGSTEEMRQLVDLWFTEEREHSRLLGGLLDRFSATSIRSHWSFSAFCLSRRVLGVRFELTVLLLTEIVSTAYYRVLRRHVPDVAVRQVCTMILRDEGGHVAFHRDRLAAGDARTGPQSSVLWPLRFRLLGYAAAMMLWVNHGECLRPFGATNREFYNEVEFEISRFIEKLRRDSSAAARSASTLVLPALQSA